MRICLKNPNLLCSPGVGWRNTFFFNHSLLCAEYSRISEHLFSSLPLCPPVVQQPVWILVCSAYCWNLALSTELCYYCLGHLGSAPYFWKGSRHYFSGNLCEVKQGNVTVFCIYEAWIHTKFDSICWFGVPNSKHLVPELLGNKTITDKSWFYFLNAVLHNFSYLGDSSGLLEIKPDIWKNGNMWLVTAFGKISSEGLLIMIEELDGNDRCNLYFQSSIHQLSGYHPFFLIAIPCFFPNDFSTAVVDHSCCDQSWFLQ